jgi:hypothetical protein
MYLKEIMCKGWAGNQFADDRVQRPSFVKKAMDLRVPISCLVK